MELLPEPAWASAEAECVACGYSLAGLVPPTVCPECGLPYSGRQFVVHGLADASSTMSPQRIVGAILFCAAAAFAPQILIMVGVTVSWWITLGLIIAGIGGLAYFIVSSPRSQGGTARIVFDHAGVTVLPIAFKGSRRPGEKLAVCTFTGHETVELRQISDTWAKLRVLRPNGSVLFSCGLQLPTENHDSTLTALKWVVGGLVTTPPPLPAPDTPG